MQKAILEHINMTVSNPDKTAEMLSDLFGWKIRWAGDSLNNGRSVHVGNEDDYVALYSVGAPRALGDNEKYHRRRRQSSRHLGRRFGRRRETNSRIRDQDSQSSNL